MMKVSSLLFQLKVLVNGRPVQEYRKNDRTYVEGRAGSRFELELVNLTSNRILVHPNIDGISAMTGKDASRNDNSTGYVLRPLATTVIPGWRLNDEETAEFFFAGAGKSYAEGSGRGKKNRGVIACTVWKERVRRDITRSAGPVINCSLDDLSGAEPVGAGAAYSSQVEEEYCSRNFAGQEISTCSVRPRSRKMAQSRKSIQQNLGAGFGDRVDHQVSMTSFVSESDTPAAAAIVYYDDLEGLQSKGLKIRPGRPHHEPRPDPFPQDAGCRPPRGWNR